MNDIVKTSQKVLYSSRRFEKWTGGVFSGNSFDHLLKLPKKFFVAPGVLKMEKVSSFKMFNDNFRSLLLGKLYFDHLVEESIEEGVGNSTHHADQVTNTFPNY